MFHGETKMGMDTAVKERALPSRRRFLERSGLLALSALVPGIYPRPTAANCTLTSGLNWASGKTLLRVTLHPPGGTHLMAQAKVTLSGQSNPLVRPPGENAYQLEVDNGNYQLSVDAPGYERENFQITLSGGIHARPVYLGRPNWPFFHIGGLQFRFEPRDTVIAVAFTGPPPDAATMKKKLQELAALGLEPFRTNPKVPSSFYGARGAALFLQSTGGTSLFSSSSTTNLTPDLLQQVRAVFNGNVRVGLPIELEPGRVRILDNQYVVRRSGLTAAQMTSDRARIITNLHKGLNADLIAFDDLNNYRHHLAAIEDWLKRGLIAYGEPNLLFELDLHQSTDDPWKPCQDYLTRQSVDQAWDLLERNRGKNNRLGSSAITVATLDTGVYVSTDSHSAHPDVNAGDMTYCRDLYWDRDCSVPPAETHGMAVYGIIAAVPDNGRAIAGMASGTKHIALAYQSLLDGVSYSETLLWLAGLANEMPSQHVSQPVPNPADVINCSHGILCLPAPTPVCEAITLLTQLGRGGKGTIVVCSAGNEGSDLQGIQSLATHPNTITVANAMLTSSGMETHWPRSNYGFWVDVCALGQDAPTLLPSPDDVNGNCGSRQPVSGAFRFGGTSAAAPMVAATAALMLSARSDLRWDELRDILRTTAYKIDPGYSTPPAGWLFWNGHQWKPLPTASPSSGGNWFSKWYGYGRLNTFKAVEQAFM